MRLYAFLLFVLSASAARAATIPDNVAIEKKLEIPQENVEKNQEIASSNQGQIDQTIAINDIDNKLRTNPAKIPVEVQNVEQALKTRDESEEIIRPAVDLRNPGPPQRQEHETQNPGFYSAEQDFIQTYKKNLNNAQVFLKQEFQGISNGIQNLFGNNKQLQGVQGNIQKLREAFISQIDKLNGTVHSYLQADSSNAVSPDEEQTKANIQKIETGLNTIKDDFNKRVKTLTEGVEVLSSLRAQNEKEESNQPASGASPSPSNPSPADNILSLFTGFQTYVQNGINNFNNTISNLIFPGPFRPGQSGSAAPAAGQPAGTQADPPEGQGTTPPGSGGPFGGLGSGSGPIVQAMNALQSSFSQIVQNISLYIPGLSSSATNKPTDTTSAEKPNNSNQITVSQNDQAPSASQATVPEAVPVAQPGPIRQILQNNPISQGVAAAVQRLQNINNPQKPRDGEKEKVPEILPVPESEDKKKGHSSGSGDNNDISGSRLSENEPSNEIKKDAVPAEEIKEQKTEEVVAKTE
ncbi:unnamed protein product [Arctia plantaginis]|uniref:Uncharacterized protein n=1 Tax=Arctia plantaginis TaxID=874455 RepID=A0A8S1BB24_ARCPL|nr:unnamed protein product [Arctia plantaginis]